MSLSVSKCIKGRERERERERDIKKIEKLLRIQGVS